MTSGLIAIANEFMEADIAPLGAELFSLRDAAGREMMTDADPRWWTGRAPLLFPIVGRLAGDRYRLGAAEYALPQHGFARRREFALIDKQPSSARFRLEADAETRAVYPFAFELIVDFALEGAALAICVTVANRGDEDMPFSFGFHPAFAWPLPFGARADAHRIRFDTDEPAPVRRVAPGTGLIGPGTEPSPVSGRELAPASGMFERDALIWDRLASRGLSWGADGTPGLRIEFPDTPWLALWQKPGAHYLCIEPWAGMADPFGFNGEIWEKPGIMRLRPAQQRQFRLRIAIAPAS
ncbi:aldose 1-epimerase family protein [Sphingopyxis panaciterrae]